MLDIVGTGKDTSVKSLVIGVLSKEWPLSAKKVYNNIKTKKHVTYQAVYKAISELLNEDALVKDGKGYLINLRWVNDLHNFAEQIRTNYLFKGKVPDGATLKNFEWDIRAVKFQEEIGPKIAEWIGNKPTCIAAVCGSGTIFALRLKEYLHRKGKYVNYIELNREKVKLQKSDVSGRNLIIVDSGIYTGTTQKRIRKQVEAMRKKLNIREIKIAVGLDMLGVSDWCCNPDSGVLYY